MRCIELLLPLLLNSYSLARVVDIAAGTKEGPIYTNDFQGIVFVEQRHVAACLARILPRIPQLEPYIRSSQLIGHGASNMAKSQVRGMALKTQQDVVRMFRDREVNLRTCCIFSSATPGLTGTAA